MRRSITLLGIIALLSTGCGGTSPSGIVESFFGALERGDAAALKETLSHNSATMVDEAQLKPGSIDRRIVGEKIDGERAIVTVELRAKPEAGASAGKDPFELGVVLLREEGLWKIDVKATIEEAVAQRAGRAMAWLASAAFGFRRAIEAEGQRLGQAFEELGTSFGKALRNVGEGFRRGIRSATEEIEKGATGAER